jgi:hypothetical protein
MEFLEIFGNIGLLAVAALVAMVARKWDTPIENLSKIEVLKLVRDYLIMIVAGFLGWYMLSLDMQTWQGFVMVAVFAMGGIQTISAIMNRFIPATVAQEKPTQ